MKSLIRIYDSESGNLKRSVLLNGGQKYLKSFVLDEIGFITKNSEMRNSRSNIANQKEKMP